MVLSVRRGAGLIERAQERFFSRSDVGLRFRAWRGLRQVKDWGMTKVVLNACAEPLSKEESAFQECKHFFERCRWQGEEERLKASS